MGDPASVEESPLHIGQHGGTIARNGPESDRFGREPAFKGG
jgi:hypothetical protein